MVTTPASIHFERNLKNLKLNISKILCWDWSGGDTPKRGQHLDLGLHFLTSDFWLLASSSWLLIRWGIRPGTVSTMSTELWERIPSWCSEIVKTFWIARPLLLAAADLQEILLDSFGWPYRRFRWSNYQWVNLESNLWAIECMCEMDLVRMNWYHSIQMDKVRFCESERIIRMNFCSSITCWRCT